VCVRAHGWAHARTGGPARCGSAMCVGVVRMALFFVEVWCSGAPPPLLSSPELPYGWCRVGNAVVCLHAQTLVQVTHHLPSARGECTPGRMHTCTRASYGDTTMCVVHIEFRIWRESLTGPCVVLAYTGRPWPGGLR
jgi:hypothetical protein